MGRQLDVLQTDRVVQCYVLVVMCEIPLDSYTEGMPFIDKRAHRR